MYSKPSKHIKVNHSRPTSKSLFKWRFAGVRWWPEIVSTDLKALFWQTTLSSKFTILSLLFAHSNKKMLGSYHVCAAVCKEINTLLHVYSAVVSRLIVLLGDYTIDYVFSRSTKLLSQFLL